LRALIQRVSKASVEVENEVVGNITEGVVVLLGINHKDSLKDTEFIINKIINLRIFGNESNDNFEKSILEINGQILLISQFTLYAETKKGRRPSFTESAKSNVAEKIYNDFVKETKKNNLIIQTGIFGAKMKVSIINEGPVTIMLDSKA
jgi:D-tyrosyl-tRNA(Tyr) deacylase|tara:strand:+ start:3231 stop:3677 length:447 start_codon:yes stop_codon:yes gene_type:complete